MPGRALDAADDGDAGLLNGLSLGQVRRELSRIAALACLVERPVPDAINPPQHPMPGHEWRIEQRTVVEQSQRPTWWIRTVDDPESATSYVSSPGSLATGRRFDCMFPADARRLALALLAAVERCEVLTSRLPTVHSRRHPDR